MSALNVSDGKRTAVPRWLVFGLIGVIVITAAAYSVVMIHRVYSDPDMIFLMPEQGASWIVLDEPVFLGTQELGENCTVFITKFDVNTPPQKAELVVRALKQSTVYLDQKIILDKAPERAVWKQPRTVDLAPWLTSGQHELAIITTHLNGPCAVLAYCDALHLATGPDWYASKDTKRWWPALSLETSTPIKLSREFPRTDQALFSRLPVLLLVFVVIFCWSYWLRRSSKKSVLVRITPNAAQFRRILLLLWILLAANNITKAPGYVGYDINGHWEYIKYVAEQWRLPLANEGWQMFQSPLYYLLSVPLHWLLSSHLNNDGLCQALRLIPLLCGIAQVEICYRIARYVFPQREDLHKLTTLIGGFLPMNVYMSQYIGNEPLTALLSGCLLLATCQFITDPKSTGIIRAMMVIGVLFGLALLSKLTTFLLAPVLIFFIGINAFSIHGSTGQKLARAGGAAGIVLGLAIIISGWFYLRNWILLGRPFIGGWDPIINTVWWQFPGYRTPLQLTAFGEALSYPIFSSVTGFWNALYSSLWLDGNLSSMIYYEFRPPWNYNYMLSCALLGLMPTIALITGIATSWRKRVGIERQGILLSVCCVMLYLAAIFHLYLMLPVYSTAKATYMLGLTPCIALLIVFGLSPFYERNFMKAMINGLAACWFASVYLAYFIM